MWNRSRNRTDKNYFNIIGNKSNKTIKAIKEEGRPTKLGTWQRQKLLIVETNEKIQASYHPNNK